MSAHDRVRLSAENQLPPDPTVARDPEVSTDRLFIAHQIIGALHQEVLPAKYEYPLREGKIGFLKSAPLVAAYHISNLSILPTRGADVVLSHMLPISVSPHDRASALVTGFWGIINALGRGLLLVTSAIVKTGVFVITAAAAYLIEAALFCALSPLIFIYLLCSKAEDEEPSAEEQDLLVAGRPSLPVGPEEEPDDSWLKIGTDRSVSDDAEDRGATALGQPAVAAVREPIGAAGLGLPRLTPGPDSDADSPLPSPTNAPRFTTPPGSPTEGKRQWRTSCRPPVAPPPPPGDL